VSQFVIPAVVGIFNRPSPAHRGVRRDPENTESNDKSWIPDLAPLVQNDIFSNCDTVCQGMGILMQPKVLWLPGREVNLVKTVCRIKSGMTNGGE
jgi:hypothetical protein